MKLVEILAKELDVWPTCAAIAVQDGDARKTVKFGGKHANPSIALMGLKGVWQARDWKYTHQSDFDHSSLASDWKTAIVTKKHWQAERDRQKGVEWKRHRAGRKQPVEGGVFVEYKLRGGVTGACPASRLAWSHMGDDTDVMQYRAISQPQAEEVEVNVFVGKDVKIEYAYAQEGVEPEHLEWKTMGTAKIDSICYLGSTEAKTDQIDGPIKWRDTVNELDAYIEEFTRERESLINSLAEEGFALIPAVVSVVSEFEGVDMGDWRNWESGDIVACLSNHGDQFSNGSEYEIDDIDRGDLSVVSDDAGDRNGWGVYNFKFIRRP